MIEERAVLSDWCVCDGLARCGSGTTLRCLYMCVTVFGDYGVIRMYSDTLRYLEIFSTLICRLSFDQIGLKMFVQKHKLYLSYSFLR